MEILHYLNQELLKRKELMQARSSNQVKILSDKLTAVQKKTAADASMAKAFREKALQMQAMLVKVKEENSALEKKMLEQKGREKSEEQAVENSVGVTRPGMVGQVQLEEATKKAERLQRALETEKAKVKQLSERVIAAEKESSSSGPLVQDLERKVEHSSKLAQNFKKEAETLKQKLVQSDAEKNKLRNEIRTLQAEMQTQLKRQAS